MPFASTRIPLCPHRIHMWKMSDGPARSDSYRNRWVAPWSRPNKTADTQSHGTNSTSSATLYIPVSVDCWHSPAPPGHSHCWTTDWCDSVTLVLQLKICNATHSALAMWKTHKSIRKKKHSPINDAPYFRKYHHSNIRINPDMRLDVPVNAT